MEEETSRVQNFTPVHEEADYAGLMQDDWWTRVRSDEGSKVNESGPKAEDRKLTNEYGVHI
ncbi:hypothetical protein EGR_09875 [Echinococcus granulosus]|uniref:Uncharacterized protein n=1 Tax=Echinococcus granulosus TaxID=6210 RepID=W6UPB8_ECHGR|nr:hypothetical protein EGR_09875 [Echinococcus granulosus]EUB55274.1 hypothetical protein EGR_09875 [Echinococcus granulosus]